MAEIIITKELEVQINKIFKQESIKVFSLILGLQDHPQKGKILGNIGGIVIKEIKYKNFRFYFLADGFKLKFANREELADLLLKFVRMSDKKQQQKVINEIKNILKTIGPGGF